MDGVMILSEMSVREVELWKVIIWGIMIVAFAGYMIWDYVVDCRYFSLATKIVAMTCVLMVLAFMSILEYALIYGYNTFQTEYEVTIDDSVGFNEFNSQYEIVSQDGDVYTVIEKDVQ